MDTSCESTQGGGKVGSKVFPAYRYYNTMRVYLPEDRKLRSELAGRLTVKRIVTRRENGRPIREINHESCFQLASDERKQSYMQLGYGFKDTVDQIFTRHGYYLEPTNTEPPRVKDILRLLPNLAYLQRGTWRDNQLAILKDILSHENGQYVAATGAGKSYIIRAICELYPEARILITTYSNRVLQDIHRDLVKAGVDVGIYCSAKKEPTGRVLACSVGTLYQFSEEPWDILLLDEKHECATLKRMQDLMRVDAQRAYAFSANHNDRVDQSDGWLEAVFGQCRVSASHKDAVADGDIVPVEVHWKRITRHRPIMMDSKSPQFQPVCYWRNEDRNRDAAEFAKQCVARGEQTLIYVDTIEHAYQVWQHLKCPVAHAAHNPKAWAARCRGKTVPIELIDQVPDRKWMNDVKERFESGELLLAIANRVWQRGVNFHHLRNLIRLDASTTIITATQVTGRVNRKTEGKTRGIIRDYIDDYNDDTFARSQRRRANYKTIGYKQFGWD